MSWFKRLITLPSNRNSVEDILGADLAAVLKGAGRAGIERELAMLFDTIAPTAQGLAGLALDAVHKALGGNVPPVIWDKLDSAVAEAVQNTTGKPLNTIHTNVERAAIKALGL